MRYITGFIDIRYHIFYENTIPAHEKNACKIIDCRGWFKEYSTDPIRNILPSDFLIFRKGFAQVGGSSQKVILVSQELYKNDTNNSKIWKAIYKALNKEQLDSIVKYKIYMIKSL